MEIAIRDRTVVPEKREPVISPEKSKPESQSDKSKRAPGSKQAPLEDFVPSEKIAPDHAVDFPADI